LRTLGYLLVGLLFGITMYKSEASSWFRIYEMFQFKSFHMYGIIGSALALGIVMTQWIKRKQVKAFSGEQINIHPKNKSVPRYLFGGIIFGLGWALTGACPGPMFTLIGAGYLSVITVVIFALLGTFFYGVIKDKLPH
jgi:uncharacterized protein